MPLLCIGFLWFRCAKVSIIEWKVKQTWSGTWEMIHGISKLKPEHIIWDISSLFGVSRGHTEQFGCSHYLEVLDKDIEGMVTTAICLNLSVAHRGLMLKGQQRCWDVSVKDLSFLFLFWLTSPLGWTMKPAFCQPVNIQRGLVIIVAPVQQ